MDFRNKITKYCRSKNTTKRRTKCLQYIIEIQKASRKYEFRKAPFYVFGFKIKVPKKLTISKALIQHTYMPVSKSFIVIVS